MAHKRSLAVTLLLALLLPILAACGGTNDGGNTTTGSAAASVAVTEASVAASAAGTEASEMASTAASAEASPAEASTAASTEASAGASPADSAAASAAAGGPAEQIDLSAIEVEDGATLRVSTWGNPGEQTINKEQFARFNEMFPNVTINYEPIAENFQTTMKADFSASTNPDVLYIDSSLLTALGPNGQLLNLRPHMEQAGVTTEDFLGEMASLYEIEGEVYALPKDFGALALFVRNDAAEKAGIDPASIKTWDDWRNAAQKMTADGVIGQCVTFETERLGALWLQKGVEPIKDGKANLNNPEVAEGIQFFSDLYKNKQAATAKEVGAGWCGEGLGQNKFAMALEGGWMLPFMEEQFADVEFTAIPIPTPQGGEQVTLVFTNGWGVAANSQYPNAAAALVLFLTSTQNQQEVLRTGFAMPTRQALLNDPYFQENPNAKVLFEAGQYGRLSDNVFGGPALKGDIVSKIGSAGLEPVFLSGADPQQALEQANQEVQSVLDSQ